MKKMFLPLTILSLMGCTTDDSCGCHILDVSSDFNILNSNNEDLLNPNTANYFDNDEIRIEHLKNDGTYIEFHQSNLDYKYDFYIYPGGGDLYTFRLLNQVNRDFIINNKITGVIKWNATERDTIISEISETSNTRITTKIWVNGELKYDMHNGLTPEIITIIK